MPEHAFTPLLATTPRLSAASVPTQRTAAGPRADEARRGLALPTLGEAVRTVGSAPATPWAFRPLVDGSQTRAVDHEARAEGFAAGFAAGAREAARVARAEADQARARQEQAERERAAQHRAGLAALAAAAQAARARSAPVVAQVEQSLHAAALALAAAVLGAELSDAPTAARAALARVLGTDRDDQPVVVRLHPRDLAAVEAGVAPEGVRLVADPTLDPGDAVAEHAEGYLDARLSSALARAAAALSAPAPTIPAPVAGRASPAPGGAA